jgi:N-acetylneuraminic acid mutarotase
LLLRTIKLASTWPALVPKYPIPVGEANGGLVGNDLVIISGFYNGVNQCTTQNYALDITNPSASWRRMDDHPIALGISHTMTVIVGMKIYMCGGYVGGDPGPHTDQCFVYDHSIAPGTTGQFSTFPNLPDTGRAGAGIVYDTASNALIFAGGATRPNTIDRPDTWMYSLANPSVGWVKKADIPLLSNHLSYVTAKDATGKERHYWMGGQASGNEVNGNRAEVYEYDAEKNIWIQRASMLIPRGHASASTRAIGCGFIIIGGTTNGTGKTTDVSYYDIPSDTWTKIGDLPSADNCLVCDINGGTLYCETGNSFSYFSFKTQITV